MTAFRRTSDDTRRTTSSLEVETSINKVVGVHLLPRRSPGATGTNVMSKLARLFERISYMTDVKLNSL